MSLNQHLLLDWQLPLTHQCGLVPPSSSTLRSVTKHQQQNELEKARTARIIPPPTTARPPVIEQLPPCLIYHQWELPLSQFTGTPACCWTLTSIKSFSDIVVGDDEEQKQLAASRRCGLRHSTRSTPLICPSQPGAERRLISSGSEEPGWNANTLHLFPPHYSGEMLFFCSL